MCICCLPSWSQHKHNVVKDCWWQCQMRLCRGPAQSFHHWTSALQRFQVQVHLLQRSAEQFPFENVSIWLATCDNTAAVKRRKKIEFAAAMLTIAPPIMQASCKPVSSCTHLFLSVKCLREIVPCIWLILRYCIHKESWLKQKTTLLMDRMIAERLCWVITHKRATFYPCWGLFVCGEN